MQSRFHIVGVEDQIETDSTSILEMEMQRELLDKAEPTIRKHVQYRYKQKQLCFYEVERMIFCRALTNVSVHVVSLLAVLLEGEFLRNHLDWPTYRDPRRTIILARNNCISDCLDQLFFMKGAKYEGQEIEPRMFLDLDAMLFVRAEHAVAAFGEQIDLYYDRFESIVQKGLIAWFYSGNSSSIRQRITTRLVHSDGPTTNAKVFEQDYDYVSMAHAQRGLSTPRAIIGAIAKEIKTFTDRISGVDYRPSESAIANVLGKWSANIVKSRSYVKDPMDNEKIKVLLSLTGEQREMPKLHISGMYVLFHRSIIEATESVIDGRTVMVNLFKKVLNSAYQVPRTLVFDNDPRHPFLRNLIHTDPPADAEPLMVTMGASINPICKDLLGDLGLDMSDNQAIRTHIIESDIDEYGQTKRSELLHITGSVVSGRARDIDVFNFEYEDEAFQEDPTELTRVPDVAHHQRAKAKGYFLGKPIRKTFNFENHVLNKVQIKDVYHKLDLTQDELEQTDDFDARITTSYEDVDFDAQFYIIGHGPTGRPIYHWERLGITRAHYKRSLCFNPYVVNDRLNCTTYLKKNWHPYDPEALKYKVDVNFDKVLSMIKSGELLKNDRIKCTDDLRDAMGKIKWHNRVNVNGEYILSSPSTIGAIARNLNSNSNGNGAAIIAKRARDNQDQEFNKRARAAAERAVVNISSRTTTTTSAITYNPRSEPALEVIDDESSVIFYDDDDDDALAESYASADEEEEEDDDDEEGEPMSIDAWEKRNSKK